MSKQPYEFGQRPDAAGATPPPGDSRAALVDRARSQWLRRLVDHSRNNNLLFYRDLRAGTLDLTGARPALLAQFLSGQAVRVDRLLPPNEGANPSAKARTIAQRARSNREEKGVATLFVALGLATWTIADTGRPPAAPVLLIPATLELVSRHGPLLTLQRSGEAQINRLLLDQLEQSFGCRVEAEALLDDDVENETDVQTVYERLRSAAAQIAGFGIDGRVVLGNFSYLKLAIVRDLRDCGDLLAQHDVIAAMAGDGDAHAALRRGRRLIGLEQLDSMPPGREFAILDADSSQQRAIAAVLDGQHGVIQGPPGTGKSQTIANLIASLVAGGKRVLFVAEKRAALEVVLRRLERAGLGHLALDMHDADVSRSSIVRRIAGNLERVRAAVPVDAATVHREFGERRERLNAHVHTLHSPRQPFGVTLYEIQGRLLRLPEPARSPIRWRGEQLQRLDQPAVQQVRDLLGELGNVAALFHGSEATSWIGAGIWSGSQAQTAVDLVARQAADLQALRATLDHVQLATGLPLPRTPSAVDELLWLLERTQLVLDTFDAQLFVQAPGLARRTAPGRRGVLQAGLALVGDSAYREALRQLDALRRSRLGAFGGGAALAREAEHAAYIAGLWQRIVPGTQPRAFARLDGLRGQLAQLRSTLEQLRQFELIDDAQPLDTLVERCAVLLAESRSAFRVARMNELTQRLGSLGLAPLLDRLRHPATPVELWQPSFEYAWLSSILEQLLAQDTALAGFGGAAHSRVVQEFGAHDRQRLIIAADRVRRAHAEAVIAAMNAHPDQEDLVRREAAKRKRHLPLRALLARAPEVLTALCPCWMASPLSVSQLIDARAARFDVVIFDEASQVLPEDAVAAILRGRQVVVAGDRHQLPPTRFFVAGEDDALVPDDPALSEGFESVLDLLGAQLEPWSLDWHYRSRDEALIAFSNRHIYNGRLITFPGAGTGQAISHVLVPPGYQADSRDESSSSEVARVVECVLEHASQRPDESLGVIAMGITHAQRIEAALDQALRGRPELDAFFSLEGHEPFFVKNLERVQGDERDAIVLSVGYGKDGSGVLAYRFGPLLMEGGERRLNVAISRARRRLTLVSSFSHLDMDPSRSRARGVELLRLYLEYAAGGGQRLSDAGHAHVSLDPFQTDVYDALRARGVPLVPQWGVSSYRLDFAAQHPHRPGRFVLAIECDGAAYRSAPTARDRDRLRQQQLEALGWRFHRIWSTEWFEHRAEQIERVVQAYQAAVAAADAAPPAPTTHAPATGVTQKLTTHQAVLQQRGTRPAVAAGHPITHYSLFELVSMVHWVESDGILRSDDEIVAELVHELGFSRRGTRIEATLRQAIGAARSAKAQSAEGLPQR